MERTEGYLLDFLIVEGEISKWFYVVGILLCIDIPKRELPIVAAGEDMTVFELTPFHRVSFCLVSTEDKLRSNSDRFGALGNSAEFDLIEDVYLPQRSSRRNQIGSLRVMPNAMHLTIMLDLVLHDDLVRHTVVILANGLSGLEDPILQLLADELLVGKVDLRHHQRVLLLA